MNLNQLTIKEIQDGLQSGEFSSEEVTTACLNQIKTKDETINAYVTVTEKEALETAKKSDQKKAEGALSGIPFSIKDNFCTTGIRTTASSQVLDDFVPPYDATVVSKLKDAGIVILGKTNMDAWAHGSSTETSDYGTTKNPWDTNRLPGGSSGGAAASVAAHECIAAIGSETAGSIRQPASWCGVVGLKPTYGRVSRYGVIAMGSSLDCPGPITKTVADSALILNVLAGKDAKDATSSPHAVEDYTAHLNENIAGLTIGIADDYFEGVDKAVTEKVMDALKVYEKLGAKVKKIKLFEPKYSIAVYTIIQRSEVSSNLARYDGIRYGNDRSFFGDEAKRRIMLGTFTLSAGYYDAYYKKAQQVRTIIIEDFTNAFKDVDVIMAPTSPSTALPVGSSKNHPMFGEMADVLVEPSSIAGLPGINIPVGFTSENLPVGLQIITPFFQESKLLNVAYKYELETEWHKRKIEL